MRTPSGVATELGLLAGSLESIKADVERGVKQKGDDEFKDGDDQWVQYLCGRIANVESLLQQIRLDVVAAMSEPAEEGEPENPLTGPQWIDFFQYLDGPQGCNFRLKVPGDNSSVVWDCGGGTDKSKAERILREKLHLDPGHVEDVLAYVDARGGHCDCEILFNAAPQIERGISRERPTAV